LRAINDGDPWFVLQYILGCWCDSFTVQKWLFRSAYISEGTAIMLILSEQSLSFYSYLIAERQWNKHVYGSEGYRETLEIQDW